MNNKDTVEVLARPYKDHLREQITNAKEATGYLSACYAEGPETFALAVKDVWEFARIDPPAAPTESRAQSVKELADAALLSLERIDTVKLAAMGRDGDAEAVGNARRLVDRLIYEIIPLCGIENPSSSQACIRHVNHDGPHSPDVGDTWKERNQ